MLLTPAADDPQGKAQIAVFEQGLQQPGWRDGRNVQIEYRWSTGDADAMRKNAADLVALAPDVILAHVSATVAALLQATRSLTKNIGRKPITPSIGARGSPLR